MKELNELYAQMGISPAVYAYGEATIARLRERFDAIDQVAEYNQAKVLAALRRNRVSATVSAWVPQVIWGRTSAASVWKTSAYTLSRLSRPRSS